MQNVAEFWGTRPPITLQVRAWRYAFSYAPLPFGRTYIRTQLRDISDLEWANVRARNPAAGLVTAPAGAVEPELPTVSPFGGHGHSHDGHGHSHG